MNNGIRPSIDGRLRSFLAAANFYLQNHVVSTVIFSLKGEFSCKIP